MANHHWKANFEELHERESVSVLLGDSCAHHVGTGTNQSAIT
jgi:hypothetical protein